jgi:hypothetical protein
MIFALIVLYPLTYYVLRLSGAWRLFVWTTANLPLVTLAILTFRRGRLPLGRGRFLTGRPAQRTAFGMLAVSLFLFFGLGVLQALWGLVDPTGW